jgi:hypothetical protein
VRLRAPESQLSGGAARALLRTRQYCSAAPVSGLSDHEARSLGFMIVREDTGLKAALPARCFSARQY